MTIPVIYLDYDTELTITRGEIDRLPDSGSFVTLNNDRYLIQSVSMSSLGRAWILVTQTVIEETRS